MYIPKIAQLWGDKYGIYPLLVALPGLVLGILPIVQDETTQIPIAPVTRVLMAIFVGIFFAVIWAFHFGLNDGIKVGFWFGIGFLVGFSHHHPIEYFIFVLGYQMPIVGLYFLTSHREEQEHQFMDTLLDDLERASRDAEKKE